jgi:hypothetical protein
MMTEIKDIESGQKKMLSLGVPTLRKQTKKTQRYFLLFPEVLACLVRLLIVKNC